MTNKQIYIGLGLLAVAVVGVIIYKKSKSKEEGKSNSDGLEGPPILERYTKSWWRKK